MGEKYEKRIRRARGGFVWHRIGQGWRTYGTRAQNGTRKDFLGARIILLSHVFIFLLPD
jgi:hypothetical protein